MADDTISIICNGNTRTVALWPGVTADACEKSIQAAFTTQQKVAVLLRQPDNAVVPLEYIAAVRKGTFVVVFGTRLLKCRLLTGPTNGFFLAALVLEPPSVYFIHII